MGVAHSDYDKARENISNNPQFDLGKVFDSSKMKDFGTSMSSTAKTAMEQAKVAGEKTKEVATSAAQATTAKIGDARGTIEAMTMSREVLTQFLLLFIVGALICTLSLNFLPIIVLAPQKFALLFAVGSSMMMASFSVIKGCKDFMEHMMQKEKLPYSGAYACGMVGVLWASLLHPPLAYIWILVFSTMQVVSLVYFLVSYIPGGKRALTFVGRACFNGCRKLCGS